jgi:hypothetical protein
MSKTKNKDLPLFVSEKHVSKELDENENLTAKDIDKKRTSEIKERENRAKSKNKKPKKIERKIPKTVQDTIPYKKICDNYIFQVSENLYSKTYTYEDLNYTAADENEEERIMLAYASFLNGLDTAFHVQITLHNTRVSQSDFEKRVLIPTRDDGFDKYRIECNEMVKDKLIQGQNGLACKKYITITVPATNLETARQKFAVADPHIETSFQKIETQIQVLNANERIRILTDVFRGSDKFISAITENEFLRSSEKSLCCPDYFEFKSNYFLYDNKYARGLFLRQYPSASLSDTILTEVTNTNLDLMISVNIACVEPDKAVKKINRQITSMKAEKIEREKKAAGRGVFSDVLSDDMKRSLIEAEEFLEDLQSRNQKMMLTNCVILIFADSFEELQENTEIVESVFRKHSCNLSAAAMGQEKLMKVCLPLGNYTPFKFRRTLHTESTVVFMPFNAKEMSQGGGVYYGQNRTSNNLIFFNRKNLINPNGFILGSPGSGKSFFVKREIFYVFLATNDDILIIDPEREYTNLAKNLGGEVIHISENSSNHFNPLELTVTNDKSEDPIHEKFNFLCSFFENVLGTAVQSGQKTVIDNCMQKVYKDFLYGEKQEMPTLRDYYKILKECPDPDAAKLATALELYVDGSLNTFSHKSNVNVNNRIVVYDIKDLGKQLKSLGMMIILENLWDKIVKNRHRGINTRIYIDEMYLLFNNEGSANFLYELYKRARKWGGIPTGITQNVEDLLRSDTARSMLSNTEFVIMLKQSGTDKAKLAEILKIPDGFAGGLSSLPSGSGLMWAGQHGFIPFKDNFPKNTEMYKLMTTRFGEANI